MTAFLGISAFYHDSAACLVKDGAIVAAAHEERFTRRKHDSRFPRQAVAYCLSAADLRPRDLDAVVFYESPSLKFDRLLETWLAFAPRGFKSFHEGMRAWLGWKLSVREILERELARLSDDPATPDVVCAPHHASHAASAFYPSGLARAAVLCLDGVGEWATTTAWMGEGRDLRLVAEIPFPHSLGLLYSTFTYYAGFRVNSGEYKLMGLAPYGEPSYVTAIRDHLIDLKDDGSFRLNLEYFDYCVGDTMASEKFAALFGGPPRIPESRIARRELDLARSIQVVLEEAVVRLARTLRQVSGLSSLCMAGGVALNCVANTSVLRRAGFERVWVQPAAGDAGGALGAALLGLAARGGSLAPHPFGDAMAGALLGPSFSDDEIRRYLKGVGASFDESVDDDQLLDEAVGALAAGQVVGWFEGRAEFGPRALGARSILADPRDAAMQRRLNRKIKYREGFRPFAPAVLLEHAAEHFDTDRPSPYMQFVANAHQPPTSRPAIDEPAVEDLQARLGVPRSPIPAVTHVDGTARLQTVGADANPLFRRLLLGFRQRTGCAALINTSFNVRGEPIVLTPEDAYRCFMRTDMDMLVVGRAILRKAGTAAVIEEPDGTTDDRSALATPERHREPPARADFRGATAPQSGFLYSVASGARAAGLACALAGLFVAAIAPTGWWRRRRGRNRIRASRGAEPVSCWIQPGTDQPIVVAVRPLGSARSELEILRGGQNRWIVRLLALAEPLARCEPVDSEPPLAIYTMF